MKPFLKNLLEHTMLVGAQAFAEAMGHLLAERLLGREQQQEEKEEKHDYKDHHEWN